MRAGSIAPWSKLFNKPPAANNTLDTSVIGGALGDERCVRSYGISRPIKRPRLILQFISVEQHLFAPLDYCQTQRRRTKPCEIPPNVSWKHSHGRIR